MQGKRFRFQLVSISDGNQFTSCYAGVDLGEACSIDAKLSHRFLISCQFNADEKYSLITT